MVKRTRIALGAGLVCAAALAAGCNEETAVAEVRPSPAARMLGPTAADANGKDFVDAKGRRWVTSGKVVFKEVDVADTERRYAEDRPPPPPSLDTLSARELAEMLRPRRLVGGYEYRLEQPDLELAEKIVAMARTRKAPSTDGFLPPNTPLFTPPSVPYSGGEARLMPATFIVGSDDRARVGSPRFFPGSANAYLSQTCTATMIGPSTALCAAHCFFQNGWIASRSITFGADTVAPVAPFGSFLADSLTLPGQWNNTEWDWDFAVLEFSPTRSPGLSTGWFGTETNFNGVHWIVGYPFDKPTPTSWIKGGTYTAAPGSRYEHNIDIVPGDSGACAYNLANRCTGIQSTQWRNSARTWNEVRRWDAVTFNFFDTYGNWP
jgi:V8-like Glu-specific endopeptidase